MAVFDYKTKDNSNPKDKPRVYFTCHPDDFDLYFEKIVSDIFRTHDCAVYYTPDMTEAIEKENLSVDLGRMNLFIVPVTAKLLTTENRAMKVDIAFAKQENVHILPFMMEKNLDKHYSTESNFENRQYLSPFSSDDTEIGYAIKLKKHLDSVLIGDELAKRVRAAFDAYIFLSYRKKDRRYANELMKLIHKNPECRDIAVWFDEFLTPGESFYDGIQKALESCKLFSLLVTPSLLEETNGKPNFVMAYEYPEAIKAGKNIFPVEMQSTDRDELERKFKEIPVCATPNQDESFRELLLQAIKRSAIAVSNDDPEHKFLIGLAYLEGIDVEIDRTRGFELILSAAEAGQPEAMKYLSEMYLYGHYVPKNNAIAIDWAKKLVLANEQTLGIGNMETITALTDLANLYCEANNFNDALSSYDKAYGAYTEHFCPVSDFAVNLLSSISNVYRFIDPSKAIDAAKKAYEINLQIHGLENEKTYATLFFLAKRFNEKKEYSHAAEVYEQCLSLASRIFDETDPAQTAAMANLALNYYDLEKFEPSRELLESALKRCLLYHPNSQKMISDIYCNLAHVYEKLCLFEQAEKCFEDAYLKIREICDDVKLVRDHRRYLTEYLSKYGMYSRLISFLLRDYESITAKNGFDSEDAVVILDKLSDAYTKNAQYSEAIDILNYLYSLVDRMSESEKSQKLPVYYSLTHILQETINTYQAWGKDDLAQFYSEKKTVVSDLKLYFNLNLSPFKNPFSTVYSLYQKFGSITKALEQAETEYNKSIHTLGITNSATLKLLCEVASGYMSQKNHSKLIQYLTEIIDLQRYYFGENHPEVRKNKEILADIRRLAKADSMKKVENTTTTSESSYDGAFPNSIEELQALLATMTAEKGPEQTKVQIREKLHKLICQKDGELSSDALHELLEIACSYNRLENYSYAAELLEKLHALAQKTLGINYHISIEVYTDNVLDKLSENYIFSGNLPKALEATKLWYSFACEYETGPQSSRTRSVKRLAQIYRKINEYDKASELLENEYAWIVSNEKDSGSYGIIGILDDLVQIYMKSGNYSKAVAVSDELYSLYLKDYGEEDDRTIDLLLKMARTYSEVGNHKKALELQKKCYDLRVNLSGEESPKSITALNNLAVIYSNIGDHQTALELSKKVFETALKVLGEDHKRTLIYIKSLAICYYTVEAYSEAVKCAKKAYELYCRNYGDKDKRTIEMLEFIANCYENLNEFSEAISALQLVCDYLSETNDENHVQTLKVRKNLAKLMEKCNNS